MYDYLTVSVASELDTGHPAMERSTAGPGGWKMQTKEMLLSEHVRKRVQLGIVPLVVGLVTSMGATGLIDLMGVAEALALVGVLIAVQMYLIVARVRLDIMPASG